MFDSFITTPSEPLFSFLSVLIMSFGKIFSYEVFFFTWKTRLTCVLGKCSYFGFVDHRQNEWIGCWSCSYPTGQGRVTTIHCWASAVGESIYLTNGYVWLYSRYLHSKERMDWNFSNVLQLLFTVILPSSLPIAFYPGFYYDDSFIPVRDIFFHGRIMWR